MADRTLASRSPKFDPTAIRHRVAGWVMKSVPLRSSAPASLDRDADPVGGFEDVRLLHGHADGGGELVGEHEHRHVIGPGLDQFDMVARGGATLRCTRRCRRTTLGTDQSNDVGVVVDRVDLDIESNVLTFEPFEVVHADVGVDEQTIDDDATGRPATIVVEWEVVSLIMRREWSGNTDFYNHAQARSIPPLALALSTVVPSRPHTPGGSSGHGDVVVGGSAVLLLPPPAPMLQRPQWLLPKPPLAHACSATPRSPCRPTPTISARWR